MRPERLLRNAIDGSYLCADYELRVTRRCAEEDLGCPQLDPSVHRASHEMIRAFIHRRQESPDDTRQVAPLSTGRSVYRLAYGDRHRGATWHDEAHQVVWLLAYAQHEFKDQGDAFPYFKALDTEDRLLPTAEDYEDLFRARDARLAQALPADCTDLLTSARCTPGTEVSGTIAQQVELSCCVERTEDLEEVTVAIKYAGLTTENLPIILASFFPDSDPGSFEHAGNIAGRALGSDEIAYRVMIESP
jgi:hypothetical protein